MYIHSNRKERKRKIINNIKEFFTVDLNLNRSKEIGRRNGKDFEKLIWKNVKSNEVCGSTACDNIIRKI